MTKFSAVEKVRKICMNLPEAEEKPFGGHTAPSFRVRDKIFVMTNEDRTAISFKARPGVQQALVESEPERFFVPKYVGHQGWVGARIDVEQDWEELADLMEESYRMTAPRRLLEKLG